MRGDAPKNEHKNWHFSSEKKSLPLQNTGAKQMTNSKLPAKNFRRKNTNKKPCFHKN